MRKVLLATVAVCAVMIGGLTVQASPYGDHPGPGWRSSTELQSRLASQGWLVDRVKADDGQWEVYGRDPNGNYVEAKYDPYTLQQTKLEYKSGPKPGSTPGPDWRPASELQGQLSSQGWQVHSIKAEKGQYEVKGVDPQGQYVEAYYDPRTLQQTYSKVKGGPGYYGKPKKDKRWDVDEPGKDEGKGKDKGKSRDKDRGGKDRDRGGKGGGGGKGK